MINKQSFLVSVNTMTSQTPLNYQEKSSYSCQGSFSLLFLLCLISVMLVPWRVLQPWAHHISINPCIKTRFGAALISAVQHGKAAFSWKRDVQIGIYTGKCQAEYCLASNGRMNTISMAAENILMGLVIRWGGMPGSKWLPFLFLILIRAHNSYDI